MRYWQSNHGFKCATSGRAGSKADRRGTGMFMGKRHCIISPYTNTQVSTAQHRSLQRVHENRILSQREQGWFIRQASLPLRQLVLGSRNFPWLPNTDGLRRVPRHSHGQRLRPKHHPLRSILGKGWTRPLALYRPGEPLREALQGDRSNGAACAVERSSDLRS
jgi:hypothetical protein